MADLLKLPKIDATWENIGMGTAGVLSAIFTFAAIHVTPWWALAGLGAISTIAAAQFIFSEGKGTSSAVGTGIFTVLGTLAGGTASAVLFALEQSLG